MAPTSDEKEIDLHSHSALAAAKLNLRYLYDPSTARSVPTGRRTRAFLRLLRSSLIYAFWRLVRYAKYVAIGSLAATLGAGALGTVVSGAGFVLAPTGIAGSIIAASIWGVGKFALNTMKRRWGNGAGHGAQKEVGEEGSRGAMRLGREPEAVPW